MSAWSCWWPSWSAREDGANKEEGKHRLVFQEHTPLYLSPAGHHQSSSIHPLDGQSSSLGPPLACLFWMAMWYCVSTFS